VGGAVDEGAEDEHVECALEDGGAAWLLTRHGRYSTLAMELRVDIRPSFGIDGRCSTVGCQGGAAGLADLGRGAWIGLGVVSGP
jgi:hypothetical protein